MPVRSLSSSVLIWPSRAEVAARVAWRGCRQRRQGIPKLVRLGCFGSFARGNWAVGSDLDLVAVVDSSDKPFERRATDWDLNGLPVPAELLVYTLEEWERMERQGGRFAATMASRRRTGFTSAGS